MFFPFANLLILGEWRFQQMESIVLFDPEAELDQFTIAKAKSTVVVVLLQIELWRSFESEGRCLGGLNAVQRQVAFILIALEAADEVHSWTLLYQS